MTSPEDRESRPVDNDSSISKRAENQKTENLPLQPKTGGEFSDPEKQYAHLQQELAKKYQTLETQFETDINDLDRKIAELQERQRKLKNLSSVLQSPKEGRSYKYAKEEIDGEITKLESQLAAIPPKKVGLIGFRKEIEDLAKKVPIQQKLSEARNRLSELDKKAEREWEASKKQVPTIAAELGIEEPITTEKIETLVLPIQSEIDEANRQREQTKKEFVSKRNSWPIIGATPDGQKPMVKQVEVRDKEPISSFDLSAYGGNAYIQRVNIGRWPSIPEGAMSDRYGLSRDKVAFGVGEVGDRRFLILRQLQNIQNRGGYAYTLLLDPGENIRKKFGYNEALIIRNILSDPVLKHYLLNEPEEIYGQTKKLLMARLEQSYLKTTSFQDASSQQFMQDAGVTIGPSSMPEPTPEQMAQFIATLPEEQRKKFTFLIRGAEVHGHAFGARNVWDNSK